MSNTISTALNMAPLPVAASNSTPVVVPPPDVSTDFEFARTNMYDAIVKGQDALDELVGIAKQNQQARTFEVVSTLINTLVSANKELIELHKKHKELTKEDVPANKTNINNNLVVSASDLLDMLKKKSNEQ